MEEQISKDLLLGIQSIKLNDRKHVFTQLEEIVDENLQPQSLKFICKLLLYTLPRYADRKSTTTVENFVKILVQKQPACYSYFAKAILDVAESYKNVQATKSTAHICLAALSWSCHLSYAVHSSETSTSCVEPLIMSQALLLYSISGAQSNYSNQKAYKFMSNLLKKSPTAFEKYKSSVDVLPENITSFVFIGFLAKYLVDVKAKEGLNQLKEVALPLLCKVLIGSKVKPPPHVIESCKCFLKQIIHNEFSSVLSSMQKALLRNPEITFETVSSIISSVSLDLSQYALDLGKSIGAHLYSKENQCQEDAIFASKCLAQQCSSSQAVEEVAKHYFGILNGSEGKLAVVTQRVGVLSGIGNLSYNIATGSSLQSLCECVIDNFIPALKLEVHEGTIVHTVSMLSMWCSKLTLNVPKKLLNFFKDAISQKNSTFATRNSYILCVNAALNDNTMSHAVDIIPVVEQTYKKSLSQSSQVPAVTEGLTAFCLLLKLYNFDVKMETKLKGFFKNDIGKLPFLSDRFLSSCSEQALSSVMYALQRLYQDHGQVFENEPGSMRGILYSLTKPSFLVRNQCSVHLKKMISTLGGAKLSCSLLTEFPDYVSSIKIKKFGRNEENLNSDENDSGNISVHALIDCIFHICSGSNLNKTEIHEICLACLIPSHLPEIYEFYPHVWLKVLSKINIRALDFVDLFKKEIMSLIIDNNNTENLVQARLNALKSLVLLLPEEIVSSVIVHVNLILKESAFLKVTQEECDIFHTPAGELYDISVIENLKEETETCKTIKRESKNYSFKEQMEEIELKKELEAKKRAKGLIKGPELSQKQLDAKKAQLEKEAVITERIKHLDDRFQITVDFIQAILDSNAKSLGFYIKELTEILISLFSSLLCANRATRLFVNLSETAAVGFFSDWAKPVAYATLRQLKPICALEPSWEEVALSKIVSKIIKFLFSKTCTKSQNSQYMSSTHSAQPTTYLAASSFSYCFPFMHHILSFSSDTKAVEQVLYIIKVHADVREPEDNTGKNYQEYFPRLRMFETLIKVVCRTSERNQILAIQTLTKVCEAASGEDCCACAVSEEVDVLLSALLFGKGQARLAALQGLNEVKGIIPDLSPDAEKNMYVLQRLFIACFDPVEQNRSLAERLWEDLEYSKSHELCDCVLKDLIHPELIIRNSAAEALAALLQDFPEYIPQIISKLLSSYTQKMHIPPPVRDQFNRIISEAPKDMWEARCGIAQALGKLAPHLNKKQVTQLMDFFVAKGLKDKNKTVRQDMLDAAVAIVDVYGKECLMELLPIFETFMDKAPSNSSNDAVLQSVVILMGTLARHLDKDDPRVKPIIIKLIEALSTPAQQVQEAVANCLPPLVPSIKEEAPALVNTLLQLLLESSSYGERKGAAYGLAGLVKGLGILSLKQLNIMNTLTDAIQDKQNHKHREGSLFAFEMLCNMLGRLFEPYVVNFLPHLLTCYGDKNQAVRQATCNTAKAVMSRLSAHGVKLILPSLITALDEDSWRTKKGSIELLGAMAYCAPKQLSSCLPNIVPKLMEVLSDSHQSVQHSGTQALKQIGSVIKNPEIQAIVPILLEALQDPFSKTSPCLAALLDTRFVHFIDAPSLALIMPVVQRAFQDRSTETRKMAGQIIGNMYSLTDQKDLCPYLPSIIPGLKQSLLDPVPEVRGVSARALGAMVKGIGESSFDDLLPWLMQTLTSEASSVDRSGAAQGLSEVIGGLGVEKLKSFMPEIISTAERLDIAPHVKDGYIMMFIYLPMVFKNDFSPFIGEIINPILKALADENEYVRDTAMRAGQRIINMYADTAIALLLPELEKGLFHENWRIRYSSVQLLGDLLFKISGVSGKMTTETAGEDDNFGTEHSQNAILGSLGVERRNRVLAGLYMGRSDVALMVRQAALHVWKIVVPNTPRTLKEILPTLFSLLLGCLASNSYDKRQVAARTLGDLVRKLGERVLPEIIPILEKGLDSDRSDQRQGVCVGLSEIMASTSKEMVLSFVNSLVPTVRRALSDPLPEVRLAAAVTFDRLHSTVGTRALDEILPSLLKQLSNPELSENTLDGLRQVMAIKSKVVLPYLVPQLTAPPVNTKALSFLSAVAGDALAKHLPKILPALLTALSVALNTPEEHQVLEYCQTVVLSVNDELGIRTVIDNLLEATRSEEPMKRHAAVAILCAYCCQRKVDISQHVPQLLCGLIRLFTIHDNNVLTLSWEALNAVTKNLSPAEQLLHISDVRQAVRFAASDLERDELLPGFCLQKGISPILPIFREAILNGAAEEKEAAAQGLGEVIRLTSSEALKPSVVHITGPLIRILGDRFSWTTKVAFLETLALLLAKVGLQLKPFLPQLQTTFLRALLDGNRAVRLRSAVALSHLILVHNRVDTLYTELHNSVKSAEDNSLKETMLHALRSILKPAGEKMSDPVRHSILNTVTTIMSHHDDSCRVVAAACVGTMCKFLPKDELEDVIREHLLDDDLSLDWTLRHGRSTALMVTLKETPESLLIEESDRVVKTLLAYLTADRLPIVLSGVRASGYYISYKIKIEDTIPQSLLTPFAKSINHPTNEVKMAMVQTTHYVARQHNLPPQVAVTVLPHLVNGTKEKNSAVRCSSEGALVAVLRLRQGDETAQTYLSLLDLGAREALQDVMSRALRKVASQPEPKEEEIDDTLLT